MARRKCGECVLYRPETWGKSWIKRGYTGECMVPTAANLLANSYKDGWCLVGKDDDCHFPDDVQITARLSGLKAHKALVEAGIQRLEWFIAFPEIAHEPQSEEGSKEAEGRWPSRLNPSAASRRIRGITLTTGRR